MKQTSNLTGRSILEWLQSNSLQVQQKASKMLTALFIIVSAWLCAHLIWLMLTKSQEIVNQWQPLTTTSSADVLSTAKLDVATIRDANLFGKYELQQVIQTNVDVIIDAPKTKLNLVLVGVSASSNSQNSLAIIENKNKQSTIGIGEIIESTNVELIAVLPDRVIIRNQGQDETLMLDGVEYAKFKHENVVNETRHVNSDVLDQVRTLLQNDPSKIFDYVHIVPIQDADGNNAFQVNPGAEPLFFEQSGLRSGDIITSLNGIDLSMPDAISEIADHINNISELNLVVERNGMPYDIDIVF